MFCVVVSICYKVTQQYAAIPETARDLEEERLSKLGEIAF